MKITNNLYDLADKVEALKHYRFAEQMRGAAIGITNNISEGSGSSSDKDFANFLNIAHRSLFECVNLLYNYKMRNYITENDFTKNYDDLFILSKQITKFKKSLII